jgi:pheromone shutdown-related protein TraB
MQPLPANVEKILLDDREVYLVGTAHVSAASVALVEETLAAVAPDAVCVELCEGRFRSITEPDRWKRTNLVTVVREGKSFVLLTQLMLAAYQRRLGMQLHIKPGAEMLAAISYTSARAIPCILADREVGITLRRALASLGVVGVGKLIFSGVVSLFETPGPEQAEEIAHEIERLKEADALEQVLREFGAALPNLRTALIDERDQFLAQKIRNTSGKRIVAVVGAAHVKGVCAHIQHECDLTPLLQIPPKSRITTAIGWSIPILIIGGMVLALYTSGPAAFTRIMSAWFWSTGIAGALGALVVRAHPLTVLASGLSAPIAALHPFLATGWIAGLVEALVREPRVCDLERVLDDMGTVRGMLSNRVIRTLLIVASTNLFVMAGMALGVTALFTPE